MYDSRRLRGLSGTLAILLAAAIIEAMLLAPATSGRPGWLPETDSTSDLTSFKYVSSAIGDALREDRAGRRDGRAGLGVLIGSSTLEWGVDPAQLRPAAPGSPGRWLKLNVIRASGRDVRHMGRLLIGSGLRPDLTVLGLNAGLWGLTEHVLDDPTTPDLAALRRHLDERHEFLAKKDIEGFLLLPMNLLLPNRLRIGRAANDALFDARIGLFAAMGYGLDTLFPPSRSLPRGNANAFLPPRAADAALDAQMAGFRGMGLFDRATFPPDSPNLAELIRLVGELREAGSVVVLVLLPEMERLRALELSEPPAVLDEALRRAFGAEAPPLLDLRDTMPESAFFDLTHLNPAGRERFTERLGRALEALAPAERPGGLASEPRRAPSG